MTEAGVRVAAGEPCCVHVTFHRPTVCASVASQCTCEDPHAQARSQFSLTCVGREEARDSPQLRRSDGGIYNRAQAPTPAPSPTQFTAVGWGHPSSISQPLLRARDTGKQGLPRGGGTRAKLLAQSSLLLASLWGLALGPELCPERMAQDGNWATVPERTMSHDQALPLCTVQVQEPLSLRGAMLSGSPGASETQALSRPYCKPIE